MLKITTHKQFDIYNNFQWDWSNSNMVHISDLFCKLRLSCFRITLCNFIYLANWINIYIFCWEVVKHMLLPQKQKLYLSYLTGHLKKKCFCFDDSIFDFCPRDVKFSLFIVVIHTYICWSFYTLPFGSNNNEQACVSPDVSS